MCGIFGIGFLSSCKNYEFIETLTKELFKIVEKRGTDASGITFVSKDKIHVIKEGIAGSSLIDTNKFKMACKIMIDDELLQIIGHCRLQTKGSYLQNVNNHPIVSNSVIGVHNGFVSNDDRLFEYYKPITELTRAGEVDTEIIFRLIDYHAKKNNIDLIKATDETTKEVEGDFACAYTHSQKPYILGLFKKFNPTVIRHYIKDNIIIYCSNDSYINEALKQTNNNWLGNYDDIKYENKSGMFINLLNNRYQIVNNLFT